MKLIPSSKPGSKNYLNEINALASQFDRIIPVSNGALPLAYQLAHQENIFWQKKIFPQIDINAFNVANDKLEATQLARQLGISYPETIIINQHHDLITAAEKLGFPLIIKNTTGCAGINVRICHNAEELHQAHNELSGHDRIFCQTLITGDTFGASGLFLNGKPLRNYCWQKTTMHPPLIGPSKRCLSTADPALNNLMLKIAEALNWNGLIDMDFIRDQQGNYHFLEINPRIWGSIAASEDADVDMMTPFWEILEGKTPEPNLHIKNGVDSALFPQYFLSACKEDDYRKLWQMLTDKSLWASAPKNDARYMHWYKREIRHAWLHSLRRTLTKSLTKVLFKQKFA